MAVKERKSLAVVTGTYQKDGQEKNRYLTVGELVETDDKGSFIDLNPYINYTALPRKDGRLLISVFSEKKETTQTAPKASTGVEDGIPF